MFQELLESTQRLTTTEPFRGHIFAVLHKGEKLSFDLSRTGPLLAARHGGWADLNPNPDHTIRTWG